MNNTFDWKTIINEEKSINFDFSEIRDRGRKYLKWIAVIIIAGLFIADLSDIYYKAVQLSEIGVYDKVLYIDLLYRTITFAMVAVFVFFAVFITNMIIRKGTGYVLNGIGIVEVGRKKVSNFTISLIFAVLAGAISDNSLYKSIMPLLHSTAFDITVPEVGGDVGFYMFERPFFVALSSVITCFIFLLLLYTGFAYVLNISQKVENAKFKDFKHPFIIKHLIILAAVLVTSISIGLSLGYSGVVYSEFYGVAGAGYTQINVMRYFYLAAPYIFTSAAVFTVIFIIRCKYKPALLAAAVIPVTVTGFFIVAMITQVLVVKPNEVLYEGDYLRNNMSMTRKAFNIDSVRTTDFDELADFTEEILDRNKGTGENVRVVDFDATLENNVQLQSNTYFYTFRNGDIVNYDLDGKETPVFVSAREMTEESARVNDSYINRKFKYTHGYGIVVNPLNKLTPQGQVEFLLSGLVMDNSGIESLQINQPRIYYGELTNDYVIVNPDSSDKEKEIDVDGNQTYSYDGAGGINLGFFNRLMFTLAKNDFNLLISGMVDSDSKILLNRNVVQRARMALPFLSIDEDAYIVITKEGGLKWILDGYTVSDKYPYADNFEGINYIRNSVKIVVDAYDGTLDAYLTDKNDPIIRTYMKIYPGVVKDEELPEYIKSHMRYPEDLFDLQTNVMQRYHLNPDNEGDVSKFYSNQDHWDIAKLPASEGENTPQDIEPYYNMVKLPDSNDPEEIILMRAFTPSSSRHNMVAWCAVRNNYSNYGDMVLYGFPKNTNILGPDQVRAYINQIPEFSEEKSLWGQGGSIVQEGNLLIIPIENSVMYVEPVYIRADVGIGSSIPHVERIIVGYQKGIEFVYGYGKTLDIALKDLFSKSNSVVYKDNGENTGTEMDIPSDTLSATAAPGFEDTEADEPGEGKGDGAGNSQKNKIENIKRKIKDKLDKIDKESREVRDLLEQLE